MQEKEALMHCNPTRRTFLKGTAATAALAAVGTCSVAAWRAQQAEAAATGAALSLIHIYCEPLYQRKRPKTEEVPRHKPGALPHFDVYRSF